MMLYCVVKLAVNGSRNGFWCQAITQNNGDLFPIVLFETTSVKF